jgi:hypothetical protein
MKNHNAPLTSKEEARLNVLLKGADEIPADYAGLTEAEAIEVIMILDGVDEADARERFNFARGQTGGCCDYERLTPEEVSSAA